MLRGLPGAFGGVSVFLPEVIDLISRRRELPYPRALRRFPGYRTRWTLVSDGLTVAVLPEVNSR
jgi:hypothetical protein